WRKWSTQIIVSAVSFCAHAATLLVLRILIHPPNLLLQQLWGNRVGWPTIQMNLSSPQTVLSVALIVSVMPLLFFWHYRRLPAWLKGAFWLIVPIWVAIHLAIVYVAESR